MRKFLVTAKSYTGVAELVYNQEGYIATIDIAETNMTPELRFKFKAAVPVTTKHLETGGHNLAKCTIVEAGFEATFEMFWNTYNKKINKLRSQQIWQKLTKTEQVQAFYGIKNYDVFLKKNDWRSKADPETYLRNKYWLNEYK